MNGAFSVEVLLPSGKLRRVKELKNKEYLTIVKFCENKDFYGLSDFFKQDYIDDDLDIIDCFYLLIYLRMVFINDSLTFTTKERRNVDFNLTMILDKLDSITHSTFDKTIKHDQISLNLGLPTAVYFRDTNDLYNNVIKEIEFNGEAVNFKELTTEERNTILDKLPAKLFDGLQSYLTDLSSQAFDITLIDENEKFNIKEIKLNLISNGVMEFIAAIFSIEMKSYYELIYAFYNTILNGSKLFEDLSPIETKILLNIHNAHIKKQNEELKKQSR